MVRMAFTTGVFAVKSPPVFEVRSSKRSPSSVTDKAGSSEQSMALSPADPAAVTVAKFETPPPEPLDIIEFCAEKCRYIEEMCTENRHQNLEWPAVACKVRFLDVESDL